MNISILQPQIIHELGSRCNQEDSVFPSKDKASEESRVFILCDGMGGHENGEVASQLVCQVLSEYIGKNWNGGALNDDLFQTALDEVFRKINEYDSNSFRKMGTTLTFLCLHQGGAFMAHVGDSRIYHVRPSEHLVLYKSRDHSLAYDLFLSEEISYEELSTYKKNVITRAIMPGQENPFKADVAHATEVQPGDYFLLCSDGMLEEMSDEELVDLLCSNLTNDQKRMQLIERTKDNKDNHSAFIIQISDVVKEERDNTYVNDESTTMSNAVLFEKKMLKREEVHPSVILVSSKTNYSKILLVILIVISLLLLIIHLL